MSDPKAKDTDEVAALKRDLAAARAPTPAVSKKPATAPVVPEDIADAGVRALHGKAKAAAEKYVDTDAGRQPLAAAAQDRLIALRDLNVSYFGHGVSLYPGGDLYVGTKGVHPRHTGAALATDLDVGALAELVDELHDKLEYEAS